MLGILKPSVNLKLEIFDLGRGNLYWPSSQGGTMQIKFQDISSVVLLHPPQSPVTPYTPSSKTACPSQHFSSVTGLTLIDVSESLLILLSLSIYGILHILQDSHARLFYSHKASFPCSHFWKQFLWHLSSLNLIHNCLMGHFTPINYS